MIIIDVERNGEAWYVNPNDNKKYYGRPLDAFRIMREQSLGITNMQISKIPIGYLHTDAKNDDNKSS